MAGQVPLACQSNPQERQNPFLSQSKGREPLRRRGRRAGRGGRGGWEGGESWGMSEVGRMGSGGTASIFLSTTSAFHEASTTSWSDGSPSPNRSLQAPLSLRPARITWAWMSSHVMEATSASRQLLATESQNSSLDSVGPWWRLKKSTRRLKRGCLTRKNFFRPARQESTSPKSWEDMGTRDLSVWARLVSKQLSR